MTIRKILTIPDKILRKKSLEVKEINKEIKNLIDDMLATMYDAPGIGLAAIQIGVLKRVVVIDVSKKEGEKSPLFLVNPEIIYRSKKTSTYEEGCLSLPGHFAEIERPAECQIKFINYEGKEKELKADGLSNSAIARTLEISRMSVYRVLK